MARKQLELSNDVAAELAGANDLIMRTLEDHLDCEVYLRGNVLTLDGSQVDVAMGETVVRELTDLVVKGLLVPSGAGRSTHYNLTLEGWAWVPKRATTRSR